MLGRFAHLPGGADRTPVAGLQVLATTVLFGVTAGIPGAAVGAALCLGWLLLPAVHVVALGQFALVALYDPATTPVRALVLVELALGSVLVASLLPDAPLRAPLAFAVSVAPLCGIALLVSPPASAVALAAVVAAVAYGLHRHERVTLGLVEP